MNKTTATIFLCLSLLIPLMASAQEIQEHNLNVIGQILSLIKEKVEALEKLFAIHKKQIAESGTGLIIHKITSVFETQSDDCDNYYKICPISPFGTRKEPLPEIPTSTVPQFTVKYADIKANLARIVYSISDIRDNQTTLWLNYGTSSSVLDHTTSRANVSYGITGRHGIDDADFLIAIPSESVCLYVDTEETEEQFLLYNPDPPTYYFRFEASNNLGTFFTPSLDLPPFHFQFDNFCGEATYYIDDLQTDL
ncbi:MAG: hypothetical protein AAB536_01885 [Patescibacteria group bacterium]